MYGRNDKMGGRGRGNGNHCSDGNGGRGGWGRGIGNHGGDGNGNGGRGAWGRVETQPGPSGFNGGWGRGCGYENAPAAPLAAPPGFVVLGNGNGRGWSRPADYQNYQNASASQSSFQDADVCQPGPSRPSGMNVPGDGMGRGGARVQNIPQLSSPSGINTGDGTGCGAGFQNAQTSAGPSGINSGNGNGRVWGRVTDYQNAGGSQPGPSDLIVPDDGRERFQNCQPGPSDTNVAGNGMGRGGARVENVPQLSGPSGINTGNGTGRGAGSQKAQPSAGPSGINSGNRVELAQEMAQLSVAEVPAAPAPRISYNMAASLGAGAPRLNYSAVASKASSGVVVPAQSQAHASIGAPPKAQATTSAPPRKNTNNALGQANMGAGAPAPRQQQRRETGIRVSRPKKTNEQLYDFVVSKPAEKTKMGSTEKGGGVAVKLSANYFLVKKTPQHCVFTYWVDFLPPVENTKIQKTMLEEHKERLGTYVFDGHCLWTMARLQMPMELMSRNARSRQPVQLIVKLVKEVDVGDPSLLQFYNIILRSSFTSLGLLQVRRNFFDNSRPTTVSKTDRFGGLTIWPGYATTLRQCEHNLLLNVGVVHKILRKDSALMFMEKLRMANPRDPESAIRAQMIGTTVMTEYNNKFYRVDDIDFTKTPLSTFTNRDKSRTTYLDYYHSRSYAKINNTNQPLIAVLPSKQDRHRGDNQKIYLVPEICTMTGLTEDMRKDFNFMKAVADASQQNPDAKMAEIRRLVSVLDASRTQNDNNGLRSWGLEVSTDPVEINARHLFSEELSFQQKSDGKIKRETVTNCDWTNAFKDKSPLKMSSISKVKKWALIYCNKEKDMANVAATFVRNLDQVGSGMGFRLGEPIHQRVPDMRIESFVSTIRSVKQRMGVDLIVVILYTKKEELYAAVKKTCYYELGVPSQCVLASNLRNDNNRALSICTKIMIQINVKMGGQPWSVKNPFHRSPTMVVGYDVFHSGKQAKQSIGAMVATMDSNLSKFYSTHNFTQTFQERGEISGNMWTELSKCILAFKIVNHTLPERIIFYRDGVGEGQLKEVNDVELEDLKVGIKSLYGQYRLKPATLTFIVVTKRINARFFLPTCGSGVQNPPPGTVVDDVVTLPERYDFYLVSTKPANDDTVISPICYHVLEEQNGLTPTQVQVFTHKMTHNYYNWCGTVSVPSVCQYAHKLANLIGIIGRGECPPSLTFTLYYL